MSEILVHTFGSSTCEIHVTKRIDHPEGAATFAATAFIHGGVDIKWPVRDVDGVAVQIAAPSRRTAISRMVEYLIYRYGTFDNHPKAIDLKRHAVDAEPLDRSSAIH
jgi:hypothetical protein